MNTVIIFLMSVVFGVITVLMTIKNAKIRNELKAEKAKEKKNAEIDKETAENINNVVSGDFHAGDNVLHQLAEKRK